MHLLKNNFEHQIVEQLSVFLKDLNRRIPHNLYHHIPFQSQLSFLNHHSRVYFYEVVKDYPILLALIVHNVLEIKQGILVFNKILFENEK